MTTTWLAACHLSLMALLTCGCRASTEGAMEPRGNPNELEPSNGGPRTNDSGVTARPTDGNPATTAACAGAIVCDDFEGNGLTSAPVGWTSAINPAAAGSLRVDDTRSFSGSKAVRFSTPAGERGQVFVTRPFPALPDNAFFGRLMMWVSATPTGVHWDNIRGSGKLPGTNQQAWYNYGGGRTGSMIANYYTSGSDCWKSSKAALPVARWVCVEWQFEGTKNELRYWLDGVAVNDLTVMGKGDGCEGTNLWKAPVFDRLSLGWYNAQVSPIAIDTWIDDVVVSASRVGCPTR